MGRSFVQRWSEAHELRILEAGDWQDAQVMARDADLVLIAVPIGVAPAVVRRLAPMLDPDAVLADLTSTKVEMMRTMLDAHPGPVFGLHPLFGPLGDAADFSGHTMALVHGRGVERYQVWLDSMASWGVRLEAVQAAEHDRVMAVVQGLRHTMALAHAQVLGQLDCSPDTLIRLATPGYLVELALVARLHSGSPDLYRQLLADLPDLPQLTRALIDSLQQLARETPNAGLRASRFERVRAWLGQHRAPLFRLSRALQRVVRSRQKSGELAAQPRGDGGAGSA